MDEAFRAGRAAESVLRTATRLAPWSREIRSACEADLLIVYRKAALGGPPQLEEWLARRAKRFAYDFDDAVYLEPEGTRPRWKAALDPRSRCARLCAKAHVVTAGNGFLAEFARKHTRGSVEVIPTSVNTSLHVPRKLAKSPSSPIVVGWSGSSSTAVYIRELLPILREAQRRVPFELLVVGADFDLEGVVGRCERWTSEREVSLLQEMDIGLMPLQDTEWERGKCSLKALLYGAVGIPAVVSKVGTNVEAVQHGVTGYVLREHSEFVDAIASLVLDEDRRRQLGGAGRQFIEERYSTSAVAPLLAATLQKTCW